jgi:hypothetical protein
VKGNYIMTATTTPAQAPMSAKVSALHAMAGHIRGAVSSVLMGDADKAEAQQAFQGAANAAVGARESAFVALADISANENWVADDIDRAAKLVVDSMNVAAEKKSAATFVSEAKNAMHPSVRVFTQKLITTATECWMAEDEIKKADKSAKLPIRAAFQRRYHLVTSLLKEAKDGRVFSTYEDVLRFAETRDPDLNAKKQADAIETMRVNLARICGNFPADDLQAAVDALGGITETLLANARRDHLIATGQVEAEPEPDTANAPAAEAESQTLGDLLGDLLVPAPVSAGSIEDAAAELLAVG